MRDKNIKPEEQRSRGQEGMLVSKATLNKCCSDSYCKNFTFHFSLSKLKGFTLAEVLITLGVIGVVAAITMPVLMTNINERINSERHANIAYKMTQAMEQMRAHSKLTTYVSTDTFVDELQKYLKIQKRCNASNIAECWPTETVKTSDGEEFNISDCKTRKCLLPNADTDEDNVGLILSDGASIILTYDPNAPNIDIDNVITSSNEHQLPVGNGKFKGFAYTTGVTGSIDFVTDVNGKKGPNSEKIGNLWNDIRSFKTATFNKTGHACEKGDAGCIWISAHQGEYNPIDCSDTSNPDYKYCYPTPSGFTNDHWASAKKICSEAGMNLPTLQQFRNICSNKSKYPSLMSEDGNGWYMTSTESDYALGYAWGMYMGGCNEYSDRHKGFSRYTVMCIK